MAANSKQMELMACTNKLQKEISKALPAAVKASMTPERFARIAISAIQKTPKLAETKPQTFMISLMQAAQLGLEPNSPLGQAYLIPYGQETTFQIGYKGLLALAYRNPQVAVIQARTVYENDDFSVEYGLHEDIVHRPTLGVRGEPVGYYAFYRMKDGSGSFCFMSRAEMEDFRRQYSKANKPDTPWNTAFDSMAKKTVIKRLLKYAPIGGDLQAAIAADETVPEAEPDLVNVIDTVASEVVDERPAELPTRRAEAPKKARGTNTRAKAPEPVQEPTEAQEWPEQTQDEDPTLFDMFA